MFRYKKDNKEFLSYKKLDASYKAIESFSKNEYVYYLYEVSNIEAEGLHLIEDLGFIDAHESSLEGVLSSIHTDDELSLLIREKRLLGCNTHKCNCEFRPLKKAYKVHVLGLGDVGGMMLAAMRLIGGETLSEIGIFDLDENKVQRWLYELNQIKTMDRGPFLPIKPVSFDDIFDCDAFIFTASSQIPEVGSGVTDVRMYQLEKNAKIISIYAKHAKKVGFKGQFIVVSDPVDLLCKAALTYAEGALLPEQIKGFGLGVMHARACFYAPQIEADYYEDKGRAFGPHGKHLIIADDMKNYNNDKSLLLTDKTIKANLDVRAVGYKPFIAPALSSAALSILACLEGKPHYSTVYIGGVYFGCRNTAIGQSLFSVEKHIMNPTLLERLKDTYKELMTFEF